VHGVHELGVVQGENPYSFSGLAKRPVKKLPMQIDRQADHAAITMEHEQRRGAGVDVS
jgi:hypothetical protein